MKKVKLNLPVIALMLGLSLVLTQSAFTSKLVTTWGQDPVLGWVDINNLPATGDPDTHYVPTCTGLEEECTRIYTSGDPINGGTYTIGEEGIFSLVEEE